METSRVGSGARAPAALKSAALRAKTAPNDARKRKRGALQDISNRSSARLGGGGGSAGGIAKKPLAPVAKPGAVRGVKRVASSSITSSATSSTASSSARARATKASTAATGGATGVAKRRRPNDDESGAHAKVQTSLLSFKSIAPPTSKGNAVAARKTQNDSVAVATVKREPQDESQSDSQATVDAEFECNETLLKAEPSQPEPTPVAAPPAAAKAEPTPTPSRTRAVHGEVPPYTPRPYVFKFDHRDSGFDEDAYRSEIRDIDAPFQHSAVHCVRIAPDMDRFHRQHEAKYHPEPNYIGNVQLDINEKMRTILVDWLVEVGEEYELDSQTFHKTVNLVDRCLTKFKINRKQFQLLGCACMMIAAKFEEVYGPNVDEFVYISDQTYTSEEMLEMEVKVLQALEYRIASTTCHGFLPRFTRAGCTTDKQKSLVQYLCDYAMLYYHMLQYRPSMLAAAAVYLSRLMTNEEQPWTPTLHHFTQYNAWDLKDCVMDLYRLHRAESEIVETQRDKAKAVSEKYVADKFHGVSATPSVDEAALEKSFLAFEQPSYLVKKQEASDASSTTSSE